MEKRKSRKKISKSESKDSLLVPFDVTKLGSNEDPCFGKLFLPTDPTCKICGDAEFCSIVMMQAVNIKRLKVEAKASYKDLEEVPLLEDPLNIIIDRLKRAEGKWVKKENLEVELRRKGLTKKKIQSLKDSKFFERMLLQDGITANKDKTKYRWT